jgi:hypothetical protein
MKFLCTAIDGLRYFHCSTGLTQFRKVEGELILDSITVMCGEVKDENGREIDKDKHIYYREGEAVKSLLVKDI